MFQFAAGAATQQLVVNGVDYEFEASSVQVVQFYGRGGTDTLLAQAADSGSRAQLSAGSLSLRGQGYNVLGSGVEQIDVRGGQGTDRATLYTSTGDDTVVARPGNVTISGDGFSITVSGYETINTRSQGGNDRLRLYDSEGDDRFTAWDDTVRLRNAGSESVFSGFDRVMVFAREGNDTALILSQIVDGQVITPALSAVGFDQYLHRVIAVPATSRREMLVNSTVRTDRSTPAAPSNNTAADPHHNPATPDPGDSRAAVVSAPPTRRITSDSEPDEVRALLHDATLERVATSWASLDVAERATADSQWALGLHELWNRWGLNQRDAFFALDAQDIADQQAQAPTDAPPPDSTF